MKSEVGFLLEGRLAGLVAHTSAGFACVGNEAAVG